MSRLPVVYCSTMHLACCTTHMHHTICDKVLMCMPDYKSIIYSSRLVHLSALREHALKSLLVHQDAAASARVGFCSLSALTRSVLPALQCTLSLCSECTSGALECTEGAKLASAPGR